MVGGETADDGVGSEARPLALLVHLDPGRAANQVIRSARRSLMKLLGRDVDRLHGGRDRGGSRADDGDRCQRRGRSAVLLRLVLRDQHRRHGEPAADQGSNGGMGIDHCLSALQDGPATGGALPTEPVTICIDSVTELTKKTEQHPTWPAVRRRKPCHVATCEAGKRSRATRPRGTSCTPPAPRRRTFRSVIGSPSAMPRDVPIWTVVLQYECVFRDGPRRELMARRHGTG